MESALAGAGSLPRRVDDGTPIVRQGQRSSSLFLVLDGHVRLSAVMPSGREVVVALLGAGDLFGESAVLAEPSPFEARAVAVASVLPVHVDALHAVLARQPATGAEVIRLLAVRLRRTSSSLQEALALDVGGRVSKRLHELAARHGVPGPSGVRLSVKVTQEDLARMVGASRESVNRTLATLAAQGLVRRRGRRVVIPDLEALAAVADATSA